ncbi:hypothetical protein PybrP1_000956 [[Pythium] brassicae (nom. inval.)]|nr:hypothetical protein PybrP1_000956 [[Pythium] brassicae (nom. inval.)]
MRSSKSMSAEDGRAAATSVPRRSSEQSNSPELRLSVSDIPMLENEPPPRGSATSDAENAVQWGSFRFSRAVTAASSRTLRALRGDSMDLSSVSSANAAGAGDGDGTSRSRAGSGAVNASGRAGSVPQLLRSMASYLGLSMEETFMCQICFENVPMTRAFRLRVCGHRFCEPCLENFLRFKVGEGQVYPTCFHERDGEPPCAESIAPEDIQAVVAPEDWSKYLKFKFNKEHENARQCPHCDHSQLCRGRAEPECVCERCGGDFCFVHSTAHRGRSCAEYEKKIVAIEKLNHAMINEISKPCPGCNNFVEKIGGCNQMKCVVCSTSFCWICREIIDDSVFPEHFQWWNIRGCPGNQMAEVEEQSKSQTAAMVLLRGLFLLVFGPPALVLAVAFSLLCCCCTPCAKIFDTTHRNAFTTCLCASGYLLLAPFVLAALLVCSPCLCCLYWYDPDTFSLPQGGDPSDVSAQETQIDISPDNRDGADFRVSIT